MLCRLHYQCNIMEASGVYMQMLVVCVDVNISNAANPH